MWSILLKRDTRWSGGRGGGWGDLLPLLNFIFSSPSLFFHSPLPPPCGCGHQHLIGKHCLHPFCDHRLPIIADYFVDMSFGTGAVKVTPALDHNVYEVGMRHRLPFIEMMDDSGCITSACPQFNVNNVCLCLCVCVCVCVCVCGVCVCCLLCECACLCDVCVVMCSSCWRSCDWCLVFMAHRACQGLKLERQSWLL